MFISLVNFGKAVGWFLVGAGLPMLASVTTFGKPNMWVMPHQNKHRCSFITSCVSAVYTTIMNLRDMHDITVEGKCAN